MLRLWQQQTASLVLAVQQQHRGYLCTWLSVGVLPPGISQCPMNMGSWNPNALTNNCQQKCARRLHRPLCSASHVLQVGRGFAQSPCPVQKALLAPA